MLGRLDPWHTQIGRELVGKAHHVVETDVKVVLDIAPLVICKEVTKVGGALGNGLVSAELFNQL
jgi:hypothetical protein